MNDVNLNIKILHVSKILLDIDDFQFFFFKFTHYQWKILRGMRLRALMSLKGKLFLGSKHLKFNGRKTAGKDDWWANKSEPRNLSFLRKHKEKVHLFEAGQRWL